MGEKTLPEKLATVLSAEEVDRRPIRSMFQEEERFGRMARIRRCWAPSPLRPTVLRLYAGISADLSKRFEYGLRTLNGSPVTLTRISPFSFATVSAPSKEMRQVMWCVGISLFLLLAAGGAGRARGILSGV